MEKFLVQKAHFTKKGTELIFYWQTNINAENKEKAVQLAASKYLRQVNEATEDIIVTEIGLHVFLVLENQEKALYRVSEVTQ